ncbi:MAG: MBL fold metallo-hydrolase [Verrucomicrobiota bacterium]|nr:MBL fold metallo-hydrolase [Verrucomicrobiota bacterium]
MTSCSITSIKAHQTPPGAITLWWLGQAGFILGSPSGKTVVLDPYLTNSCKAIGVAAGFDMDRLAPPPLAPSELAGMDAYLLTHSHQDHLDPETLSGYRSAGGHGPFFAPAETVARLQALGVPADQVNLIWPNKTFTIGDLSIRVTFAIPFAGDDLTHVGYLVSVKAGPTVYFTGDTDYNPVLALAAAPHKPDVLVTVINGAFRNLGPAESALLAKQLDVKRVIPCHHDLFHDNCMPPQMLHTHLKLQGIGERYCQVQRGVAFVYVKPPE